MSERTLCSRCHEPVTGWVRVAYFPFRILRTNYYCTEYRERWFAAPPSGRAEEERRT
jgi:hypothetical protein